MTSPPSARRSRAAVGARVRLAVVTLLVATAPVAVGGWLLAASLGDRERGRADARLHASLRAARADLTKALAAADRGARRLAASPAVQRAILEQDRRRARELVRRSPSLVLYAGGEPLAGSPGPHSIVRSVAVIGSGGRQAGTAGIAVPLDAALLAQLQRGAPTTLLFASGGRVVAGPFGAFQRVEASSPVPSSTTIGGRSYRAASLALPGGRALMAAIPVSEVEAAAAARARDAALAALVTLLTILIAAETIVPLLGRARRAADEESLELLGAALAAAHDREALLPLVLESLVEAAGAVGGVLLEDGVEVARVGDTPAATDPLVLRLAAGNGALAVAHVHPPARGFSRADRRRAEWFATQVAVAVENARQHEITALEAVTDPLTGLANRRRFVQQLEAEAERSARSGRPVAVIAADLDDFKLINDRFGHEAGDEVLRAFARVLRGTLREIDVAARLGGEEFAVLLPETDEEGAATIADRLRARLADLRLAAPGGETLSVTASFGYAASGPASRVEDLPAEADRALYRAKREGKNRVVGVAR